METSSVGGSAALAGSIVSGETRRIDAIRPSANSTVKNCSVVRTTTEQFYSAATNGSGIHKRGFRI